MGPRMFSSRKKISKEKGAEPNAFEESVAQAFFDLEATNQELKSDLRDLYITGAKEVDVNASRKAIIIHVPYRLKKSFNKIQQRLVRELEKKFSGKDVVLIANRRIMPPAKGASNKRPRSRTQGASNKRPRSRTLTSVHEKILE